MLEDIPSVYVLVSFVVVAVVLYGIRDRIQNDINKQIHNKHLENARHLQSVVTRVAHQQAELNERLKRLEDASPPS